MVRRYQTIYKIHNAAAVIRRYLKVVCVSSAFAMLELLPMGFDEIHTRFGSELAEMSTHD